MSSKICGVKIKKLTIHKDIPDSKELKSKGLLIEVLRRDDYLLKKFGQSVFTITYGHGTIKGFHWHKEQDDVWFFATGKVRIVLYDRRRRSSTYKSTMEIIAGENNYKLIFIPRGIAHAYQVISKKPVMLFYHVTKPYNKKKPDEQRIPYNDPMINFHWSKGLSYE